jgi:hypothetical protein
MRDDIRFVTRCAAAITAALQGSRTSAQGQAVRTASQTARQRQHG